MRWSGQYDSFGQVKRQSEGFQRLASSQQTLHQPLRYAGQYADDETGLHYNLFRYYDPQMGRFTVQDPIGLAGGINLYAYGPNPLGWIDPLGLSGKPLNSPDITKWNNKGGTVWQEIDTKTWVYKDASGNVVRYPNGYPDFTPYEKQRVDIPDLQGNHSKTGNGDFAKADAAAPKGKANYDLNTWHHHENGKTMQEVPKEVHRPFTHRGGGSNINKKC